MAVVGSGPAGFYAAYRVISKIHDAKVDMYESLPVPFGLVRFGVAPDHPEVKNCQDKFTEVASSPNFQFIGNIEIGRQLSLKRLQNHYDAILFAYGASEDKKLAVPGEDDFKGIYSARHFVGWYNGLPDYSHLQPDLSTGRTAIIIGQGNVALDVARILLTDVDVLRKTDITDHALSALSKSKVEEVRLIGRRGPMQASFTIKEARELVQLPNVVFHMGNFSLLPPPEMKLPRTQRRLVSLLREGSHMAQSPATKAWYLESMLSPKTFEGDASSSELEKVRFRRTEYENASQAFESRAKVSTQDGEDVAYETSLAFRSIGYKSVPIAGMDEIGIPFDHTKGIIPNDSYGRVIADTSPKRTMIGQEPTENVLPGLYCAGWVKRGPAGVIANTMEDSFSTADAIVTDWTQNRCFLRGGDGWDAIKAETKSENLRTVSWAEWLKIDAAEKAQGKARGKEREKFTKVSDMLAVLD